MSTGTLNSLPKEAARTASPQLAAAHAFSAHVGDVTLELADLTIGQLSAVALCRLPRTKRMHVRLRQNERWPICSTAAAAVPSLAPHPNCWAMHPLSKMLAAKSIC